MRGEAARLTDHAETVTQDTESEAELPGNSVSIEMFNIPPIIEQIFKIQSTPELKFMT